MNDAWDEHRRNCYVPTSIELFILAQELANNIGLFMASRIPSFPLLVAYLNRNWYNFQSLWSALTRILRAPLEPSLHRLAAAALP